jgi:hypothetical protein
VTQQPSLSPRDAPAADIGSPEQVDVANDDFGERLADPPTTEEMDGQEAPVVPMEFPSAVDVTPQEPPRPQSDVPPRNGIRFPESVPSFEVPSDERDRATPPENPFDTTHLEALPMLLPGGLHSHEMRRWADGRGEYRIKARLMQVREDGAELLTEDGTVAVVPFDRLAERDAAFVALQIRAAESTGRWVASMGFENARGRLFAALDAPRDADATVRVTR